VKKFLLNLWKDEKGVESIEWVGVGIAILIMVFIAYNSGLGDMISNVLNTVGDQLQTEAENIGS